MSENPKGHVQPTKSGGQKMSQKTDRQVSQKSDREVSQKSESKSMSHMGGQAKSTRSSDHKMQQQSDGQISERSDFRSMSYKSDSQVMSPRLQEEREVSDNETEDDTAMFIRENSMSNLTLMVEDRPLYVCKEVLEVVSPVFRRIFQSDNEEGNLSEITMHEKKYHDVLEFLYCVFPDTLKEVSDRNVAILLPLADEYQIKNLKDRCEQILLDQLKRPCSAENIVRYLVTAEKFGLNRLLDAALDQAVKQNSTGLTAVKEYAMISSVTTTSLFLRRTKILEKALFPCEKFMDSAMSDLKNPRNYCAGPSDGRYKGYLKVGILQNLKTKLKTVKDLLSTAQ